jgi:hypothetical protein
MSSVQKKTIYFEEPGTKNTKILLQRVKEYAENEGIKDIVVASTTGATGAKATKILKGFNVVVVTHSFGAREPGQNELQNDYRKKILESGARISTGVHAPSSAERAVRKEFGTIQPLELIANVLRLMGEGTKCASKSR